MTKRFSAVFAAAAGAVLIGVSAPSFAFGWQDSFPMSVSETGPVDIAQRQDSEGLAGRAGFETESEGYSGMRAVHEVQSPSRGGPIDD